MNKNKIGKMIGYTSIFLSILCFLAVFCFQFPEVLTSPELREVYTGEMMKTLLTIVIIVSSILTLLGFLYSKMKWSIISLMIIILTIVIGGLKVQPSAVDPSKFYLGLDWLLLDLFLMAIIFIPIEMIWPKRITQKRFHAEWKTDLVYFIIGHLLIQVIGVSVKTPVKLIFRNIGLEQIHDFMHNLPFVVELFFAFFITDLFQYWTHRLFHTQVFLWRFHSVHHSTRNMDWLAGSRTHIMDIVITRMMVFFPLYIFGFSDIVFSIYILFMTIHAVLIHANTRINFGFLKYIFATPQYHHWHHTDDPKYYDKNFATIFPFIDMIFGTYYLPKNVWPESTGVREANFPKGYVKQFIYPFTKSPFDTELTMEEKTDR